MKRIQFTVKEIMNSAVGHLNQHLVETKAEKKSKYKNQKVTIEGVTFDSKREAGRYSALKMMERAGLITNLRRQVKYQLNEGGKFSLSYVADFVYLDDKGNEIVEDSKGYRTEVYKKKRRLMKEIYGIIIKET